MDEWMAAFSVERWVGQLVEWTVGSLAVLWGVISAA